MSFRNRSPRVASAYRAEPLEPRRMLVAIASDQTLTGSIASGAEVDEYTIAANAGESLIVSVGETASSGFDPSLRIFSPTNALLNTSAGATGTTRFQYNLPATGTYRVEVFDDGANETGNYAVTVAKLPGAQASNDGNGGALASGVRRSGSLALGDLDVYTITANQGGAIFAAIGESTPANFEAGLVLYGPNGAQLDFVEPATGGNVYVNNLPTTGTYYLMAYDQFGDESGDYDLTAVTVAAPQPTDADSGPIASGVYRAGQIDLGDLDVYTITANQGGSLFATIGETANTAFDPSLLLFGPGGQQVDFVESATGGSVYATNLAASGTYTLLAYDNFGEETGAYGLTAVVVPGVQLTDGDSLAVTSGAYRTGRIEPGDLDVYRVTGTQGGALEVVVGERGDTAFDPSAIIFGPGGQQLDFVTASTGGEAFVANLPANGTYYVVVYDEFNDEVGEYGVTVTRLGGAQATDAPNAAGDFADGGAILSGERRVGSIVPGDLDTYTFAVDAGDSIYAVMGDLNGDGFDPQFYLYGPSGAQVTGSEGSTGARLSASSVAAGGTYTLVVQDQFGDETGEYALSVAVVAGTQANSAGDGGALAVGQSRAGAISVGDLDVFTFSAVQGTTYTVNLAETASAGFDPAVWLIGPTGTPVAFNAGSGATSVTLTNAPLSGTYTALVFDEFGDETGAYSVALNAAVGADTLAPAPLASQYRYDAPIPELRVLLNEDVSVSFDPDAISLIDRGTGQPVANELLSIAYEAAQNAITIDFPALPGRVLPDGNYRLRIAATALADAAGNRPASDLVYDFFVLAGDLDRNRAVGFSDLVILAQNYNGVGRTYSQGNIDYSPDGSVGFGDLVALAQSYNRTLPSLRPAVAGERGPRERRDDDAWIDVR